MNTKNKSSKFLGAKVISPLEEDRLVGGKFHINCIKVCSVNVLARMVKNVNNKYKKFKMHFDKNIA
jgi:hypothetical protein